MFIININEGEFMEIGYEKYIKAEDEIYRSLNINIPKNKSTGNEELDKGLNWISDGVKTLFDFGCGNGTMIFYCALRGVESLHGIDLSTEAIKLSKERAKLMKFGSYDFKVGSIRELKSISDEIYDGIILSNIVDNLKPKDATELLGQAKRILKSNGKILIKLNPYITEEQIKEWNIKIIENNLLDDGLLLWNQTTEQWRELLQQYFKEEEFVDIYFPEHDQYNRMFLMRK